MIVEGITQSQREQAEDWIRCLTAEIEHIGKPTTMDDWRYVALLREKLSWFAGLIESPDLPA